MCVLLIVSVKEWMNDDDQTMPSLTVRRVIQRFCLKFSSFYDSFQRRGKTPSIHIYWFLFITDFHIKLLLSFHFYSNFEHSTLSFQHLREWCASWFGIKVVACFNGSFHVPFTRVSVSSDYIFYDYRWVTLYFYANVMWPVLQISVVGLSVEHNQIKQVSILPQYFLSSRITPFWYLVQRYLYSHTLSDSNLQSADHPYHSGYNICKTLLWSNDTYKLQSFLTNAWFLPQLYILDMIETL